MTSCTKLFHDLLEVDMNQVNVISYTTVEFVAIFNVFNAYCTRYSKVLFSSHTTSNIRTLQKKAVVNII